MAITASDALRTITLPPRVTANFHDIRSTINGKTAGPNEITLNGGRFVFNDSARTVSISRVTETIYTATAYQNWIFDGGGYRLGWLFRIHSSASPGAISGTTSDTDIIDLYCSARRGQTGAYYFQNIRISFTRLNWTSTLGTVASNNSPVIQSGATRNVVDLAGNIISGTSGLNNRITGIILGKTANEIYFGARENVTNGDTVRFDFVMNYIG